MKKDFHSCALSYHGQFGGFPRRALCDGLRCDMRCTVNMINGHGTDLEFAVRFRFCGKSRDVLVSEQLVERFGVRVALKMFVLSVA